MALFTFVDEEYENSALMTAILIKLLLFFYIVSNGGVKSFTFPF